MAALWTQGTHWEYNLYGLPTLLLASQTNWDISLPFLLPLRLLFQHAHMPINSLYVLALFCHFLLSLSLLCEWVLFFIPQCAELILYAQALLSSLLSLHSVSSSQYFLSLSLVSPKNFSLWHFWPKYILRAVAFYILHFQWCPSPSVQPQYLVVLHLVSLHFFEFDTCDWQSILNMLAFSSPPHASVRLLVFNSVIESCSSPFCKF